MPKLWAAKGMEEEAVSNYKPLTKPEFDALYREYLDGSNRAVQNAMETDDVDKLRLYLRACDISTDLLVRYMTAVSNQCTPSTHPYVRMWANKGLYDFHSMQLKHWLDDGGVLLN